MKKLFSLFLISFVFVNATVAQQGQLMVKGSGKGLYIDHSVVPKEGLFAIGRAYNVSPKTIASYNKLDMSKGLSIGQVIHIPLTDTNFSQKSTKGKPIYYKAGDKETLQKISAANNKVTVQKLRDWNKLSNDNVKAGTKLIVGYLVSDGIANTTASTPVKEEPKKQTEEKTVAKTDVPKDKPATKTEELKDKPVVKKEEPKKEEPKKTESIAKKEEPKKEVVDQSGYFKSSFDQQVKSAPLSKTETVTSGIFKTTSGLQDAKYYLLADGLPSGTIVKVINPDNNKTIYAKVLGEMEDKRTNQGLNIRISNVAASTLGIADMDKFIVKINY